MKKFFLTALICIGSIATSFAQNDWKWDDQPSSVTISLGAPSLWDVCKDGTGAKSFGAYSVRYDYNVLKWLAVGGRLSYEGQKYNMYDYTLSDNAVPTTTHQANVLMDLLFTYVNREHVQLYSGLAMGLMYEINQPQGYDTSLRILPGWTLIPIGVRAGGKNVYALAEVTLGTISMMNIGMGVRF